MKFAFNFSGPNTFTPTVPVSGTFSASDPETTVQLQLVGVSFADVSPDFHQLSVVGTCAITTPDGTTLGTCRLLALDQTSNGAVDIVNFEGDAANGSIIGTGQLASGNINID